MVVGVETELVTDPGLGERALMDMSGVSCAVCSCGVGSGIGGGGGTSSDCCRRDIGVELTARLELRSFARETLGRGDGMSCGPGLFGVDEEADEAKASISSLETPFWFSRMRSFLFSSRTLRAAVCISDEASIPICSHTRHLVSSSCRYSFLRARERRWLSRILAKLAF